MSSVLPSGFPVGMFEGERLSLAREKYTRRVLAHLEGASHEVREATTPEDRNLKGAACLP